LNIAEKLHLFDGKAMSSVAKISGGSGFEFKRKGELLKATVFARVTPEQKLDIVSLYQEKSYTVAMTGDGINDAPALRKADVGVAMGERGTQIAKEAAAIILKDDSFNSIVSAVEQGRIIFENIQKSVIFLLSCNLTEVMVIAAVTFCIFCRH
jgi:Ca2+-transporting ATPase